MSSKAEVVTTYSSGTKLPPVKHDSALEAMIFGSQFSEKEGVESVTVTVTETFTYRNGELEETQAGSYAMPELADLTP
jgi:hypothetical protein